MFQLTIYDDDSECEKCGMTVDTCGRCNCSSVPKERIQLNDWEVNPQNYICSKCDNYLLPKNRECLTCDR